MIFDDGSTTITFFPTAYQVQAEDFTELRESREGEVIAAENLSKAATMLSRELTLIRTTAERDALKTFLLANDGTAFEFTDDVGRVWNARWWERGFDSAESDNLGGAAGWHDVTVRLWLASVASDAGLEAYSNTDVSQMSIQKSGAAVLYWPLAYSVPLGRLDIAPAAKRLGEAALHRDAARYTARREHSMTFDGLERAFVRRLEDYYVDTLAGAAHPFTLAHFRDGSTVFRWLGGLSFTQDEGGRYSGGFQARQEV